MGEIRWPAPTLEDHLHFMGSTPPRDVAPLWVFPVEKRAKIEAAVLALRPPPKWIDFGVAQIESRAWYEWHWYRGIDPDKRRPSLPESLRAAVIERDGYVCGLCGGDVEPTDVHIDHVLPRSKGGPDALPNLQVAHSACNLRKGARV